MGTVVQCVDFYPHITARGLFRREFEEYFKILEEEYGEQILHCDVRWLFR
jgi:hypothetical protein